MSDFATIAAITAGATSALSAITSLLPEAQNGVVGNWADRILLVGLLQGKEAWQCFRRNCRRLDQKENHLLYRSLLEAHWRAVAQAAAGCAGSHGFRVTTAADSLPLPLAVRDLVTRAAQPRYLPEEVEAEAGHLRRLVQVCEERSKAAPPHEEWTALLDPLYDDLTVLVAQGLRPTLGPTEQAWRALEAEFPDACGSLGFRGFFAEHWFDCFLVEFQSLVQRPEVAPLLMGKLFAEIRERESEPALDPAKILSALTGMEERIVGEVRAVSVQLADVERNVLDQTKEMSHRLLHGQAGIKETLSAIAGQMRPGGIGSVLRRIPHGRNPYFQGRDRLIGEVLTALASGDVVLQGAGGWGKTEVALEICHRYPNHNILWLHAESQSTINEGIFDAVQRLAYPHWRCANLPSAKMSIREWLQETKDWLVVLDNVDEPELVLPLLTPLISPGGQRDGRVLMTTRVADHRIWPQAQTFSVEALELEDAVSFLVRRIDNEEITKGAATQLQKIAQSLGGWPLALEQAGALLSVSRRHSLEGFLKKLQADIARGDLGILSAKPVYGPSAEQGRSVARTLEMNFREASSQGAALQLVGTLCVLGEGPVPMGLFASGAGHIGAELEMAIKTVEAGADAVLAVLEPLVRYSLAKVDLVGRTVTIHPLNRLALRQFLDPARREELQLNALALLGEAIPHSDPANWSVCGSLAGHVQHVFSALENPRLVGTKQVDAAVGAVRFLRQTAQSFAAMELADRALKTCEYGSTALSKKAELLCAKGVALVALGRLKDASGALGQANSIFEALGSEHQADLTMAQNQLAICLEDTGADQLAGELYRSALGLRKTVYGPDHLLTTASLTNWASFDLGCEPAHREEHLQLALGQWEKLRGKDHPDYATALDIRGVWLAEFGRYDLARRDLEMALSIRQASIGPNHPHTATSLNNLGCLELLTGRTETGLGHLAAAFAARQKSRGADHYETLKARANFLSAKLTAQEDSAYSELLQVAQAQERVTGDSSYFALCVTRHNLSNGGRGGLEAYSRDKLRQSARCRLVIFDRVRRFFGDRP